MSMIDWVTVWLNEDTIVTLSATLNNIKLEAEKISKQIRMTNYGHVKYLEQKIANYKVTDSNRNNWS